jgi:phage anti-repressor protein/phage antirepressor YoqD-like protein
MLPVRLLPVSGEQINAVSARDLHAFLGVKSRFDDWIKNRVEDFDFKEHQDFEVFLKKEENPQGGRPAKEYILTLDMAKELAMVERNEKGKEARAYFLECERKAKAPAQNPFLTMSRLDLLKLGVEQEEKIQTLGCKVQEQQATIATLEPQAQGLNRLATTAQGALTLTESAKVLQEPPRKFITWLHAQAWIYRSNGNNVAFQDRINAGFMEHKFVTVQHDSGPVAEVPQPLITPKGITKLAAMLGKAVA